MSERKQDPESTGDQSETDAGDSNEKADDQVEILQPDGSPAPRAE